MRSHGTGMARASPGWWATTANYGQHLGKGSESVFWILWWRTPEPLSPSSLPVGARLTKHGASWCEAGPDRCSFILNTSIQTAALNIKHCSCYQSKPTLNQYILCLVKRNWIIHVYSGLYPQVSLSNFRIDEITLYIHTYKEKICI